MQKLSSVIFKNEFVKAFPGDESGSIQPRQTPGVLYSRTMPTPVNKPALIGWSDDLARELDLERPDQADTDVLGGNLVTPSMYPYAACYAGHQFGSWAGQLGDGRAITLGELQSKGKSWELQLKGAGPTPYSRRADGRAVLRSSVREYLMSEAMFHLGVPTTRALALVSTGDQVLRDMFYNGHAEYEPGAIVMRVAPSFLRFGNFEILADRGEGKNLKNLIDWTIEKHYPHIEGDGKILKWFGEVVERTAFLMTEWMRVGFVHGVMNTDNMSILGLTIDYGPYSFLDDYDPAFTPNTTDLPGRRYAFGRQASIGYWNLGCLANALAPLFESTDQLKEVLESFVDIFWRKYYEMMAAKLGFDRIKPEDNDFVAGLERTLVQVKADMTMFYQLLRELPRDLNEGYDVVKHFGDCFYKDLSADDVQAFRKLILGYSERLRTNECTTLESLEKMKKANPRFVLRNYLLHEAIEKLENGDNSQFLNASHRTR